MPSSCGAGRGVGRRRSRESEVADLDAAVFGEQDVLGLDIAMHDPGAVRCGETREDRVHDRDRLRHRESALLTEEFAQGDTGKVLHDQIGHVAVLALVEDVDHMRVGEPGRRPCLLDEPTLEHGVVAQVAVHHLERDASLEPEVGGHVHGRHASARDARAHPVSAVDQTSDQRVGLLTRAHDPKSTEGACEPAERLTPAGAPEDDGGALGRSPVGGEPRVRGLLPLRVPLGIRRDLHRLRGVGERHVLPPGDVEESAGRDPFGSDGPP